MLHKRSRPYFEKTCAMPVDMGGGTLIGLLLVEQQLKII
jgi:hypothetical protein